MGVRWLLLSLLLVTLGSLVTIAPFVHNFDLRRLGRMMIAEPGKTCWADTFQTSLDPASSDLREEVISDMKESWESFRKAAWGYDSLKPLSQSGANWVGLGVMIVDSLGTLYMMDLKDEFEEAVVWVDENFLRPMHNCSMASFFEQHIRVVGGLASASALSGDKRLLAAVDRLAFAVLDALDLRNVSVEDLTKNSEKTRTPRMIKLCEPTATAGTALDFVNKASHTVEYQTMAMLTGDKRFLVLAESAQNSTFGNSEKYPAFRPCDFTSRRHLAGGCDSYFEYLLKYGLQAGGHSGESEHRLIVRWRAAMDDALASFFVRVNATDPTYVHHFFGVESRSPVIRSFRREPESLGRILLPWEEIASLDLRTTQEVLDLYKSRLVPSSPPVKHPARVEANILALSCFTAGMFALAYTTLDSPEPLWLIAAEEEARSCMMVAASTPVGLTAESAYIPTRFLTKQTEAENKKGPTIDAPQEPDDLVSDKPGAPDDPVAFSPDNPFAPHNPFSRDKPFVQPVVRDAQMATDDEERLNAEADDPVVYETLAEFIDRPVAHDERLVVDIPSYLLRPEVIESLWYLHRATNKPKYRHWGLQLYRAMQAHCRTSDAPRSFAETSEGSLGGLGGRPVMHDNLESFFFAETLKYLYLLFSDTSDVDFRHWIFTTEGHPVPMVC